MGFSPINVGSQYMMKCRIHDNYEGRWQHPELTGQCFGTKSATSQFKHSQTSTLEHPSSWITWGCQSPLRKRIGMAGIWTLVFLYITISLAAGTGQKRYIALSFSSSSCRPCSLISQFSNSIGHSWLPPWRRRCWDHCDDYQYRILYIRKNTQQ